MSWEQLSLFTDEELGISTGIIGLTGYARAGKDTVAKKLVEEHGYVRLGFADEIREFLIRVNPILGDGHRINETVGTFGWEIAKAQDEVRRLLQETGTTVRYMFGEDFWIKAALEKVNPTDKIVITDVRFRNEAEAIKDLGGQVWRVTRPGVGPINGHISESEMDDYPVDHTIVNDGDLDHLYAQVQNLL